MQSFIKNTSIRIGNSIKKLHQRKVHVYFMLFIVAFINIGIFIKVNADVAGVTGVPNSPYQTTPQELNMGVPYSGDIYRAFNHNPCLVSRIPGGTNVFGPIFTFSNLVTNFQYTATRSDVNTAEAKQGIDTGIQGCNSSSVSDAQYEQAIARLNGQDSSPSFLNLVNTANTALLQQRPLSGVDFVQNKVYALTHIGSVYAIAPNDANASAFYNPGGTGYQLLQPIQAFWSWSFRLVSGFLVLLIIVIAFAIMFKQKLSGSVEVTIQNAIPSIALAMVLVPLSYAISGLFIDFLNVGSNAVHEFLIGQQGSPGYIIYQNSQNNLLTYKDLSNPTNSKDVTVPDRAYFPDDPRVDWIRARDNLTKGIQNTADKQAKDVISTVGAGQLFKIVDGALNTLSSILPHAKDDPSNSEIAWFGDIIGFVIGLMTLWISVQIFLKLFSKYLTLILMPIISPFIFATVAIPGNGTKSIMLYLKTMFSASVQFIVVYMMFLLSFIFTSPEFQASVPVIKSGAFNPPILGLHNIGVGSGDLTGLILTLIGLGIYFSIPKTMDNIDKALGTDLVIPEFIKTPFNSAKESYNKVFKTAPTAVLKVGSDFVGGIRSGAKNIATARQMPGRAAGAARQAAMDFYNRRRGIEASNVDSIHSQVAATISSQIAEKERKRTEALANGKFSEARKLSGEISGLKQKAEVRGVSGMLSGARKPEEEAELKVVFKWKGQENFDQIVLTTAEVTDIINAGGYSTPLGKLVFTVKGKDVTLPENVEVQFMEVDVPANATFITSDRPRALSGVVNLITNTSKEGDRLFVNPNTEEPVGGGPAPVPTVRLELGKVKPETFLSGEKNSFELPVKLVIQNAGLSGDFSAAPAAPQVAVPAGSSIIGRRLFGNILDPVLRIWTGNAIVKNNGGGLDFGRVGFQIGERKSNVIKITVKYSG